VFYFLYISLFFVFSFYIIVRVKFDDLKSHL